MRFHTVHFTTGRKQAVNLGMQLETGAGTTETTEHRPSVHPFDLCSVAGIGQLTQKVCCSNG